MTLSDQVPIKELEVVAGLIRVGDRFLIAQRKSDSVLAPDLWEFAGGKVEDGEDPRAALIREFWEELRMRIEVVGEEPYMTVTHDYETPEGVIRIHLACYEGTADSERFELRDVQDARLIKEAELFDFEFAPADVPIVEKLAKR